MMPQDMPMSEGQKPAQPLEAPKGVGPSLIVAAAVIAVGPIAAIMFFAIGMSVHSDNAWALVVAGAIVLATVIVGLARVWRAWRERRLMSSVKWLAGLVAGLGLVGAIVIPTYERARCGAFILKSSATMKSLHTRVSVDLVEGRDLPRSLVVYFIDEPGWDDTLGGPCSGARLRDVRIGAHSLEDLRKGRVTHTEIDRAIAEMGKAPTWERIGRFTMCRDVRALRSFDASLIVGWDEPNRPGSGSPRNVLLGDGHVILADPEDFERLRAQDGEARERLGLGPLPPDAPFGIDPKRE